MTKTIEDRLTIYGPSACPICGNSMETIFFGRNQLTCRNHPGHPLFNDRGRHEAGLPHMEDRSTIAATRLTGRV